MTAVETELDMVRRHVRQGAEHISKQRALIDRLTVKGLSTEEAGALLANFECTQHQHKSHLARIKGG